MRKTLRLVSLGIICLLVNLAAIAQDLCPVKIVKQTVGSNLGTPTVFVQLENTSNVKADGVKVVALCFNNFNEPVNDVSGSNVFMGISQSILHPKRKQSLSWPLYLHSTTTKIDVFISEVHFVDGTTWTIKSKDK